MARGGGPECGASARAGTTTTKASAAKLARNAPIRIIKYPKAARRGLPLAQDYKKPRDKQRLAVPIWRELGE